MTIDRYFYYQAILYKLKLLKGCYTARSMNYIYDDYGLKRTRLHWRVIYHWPYEKHRPVSISDILSASIEEDARENLRTNQNVSASNQRTGFLPDTAL